MGILLAYAALMPVQEVMVAQGNGASRYRALALLSPAVLLKNALGLALGANRIPANHGPYLDQPGGMVVGALVLAVWVFLRAQGVETWEATTPAAMDHCFGPDRTGRAARDLCRHELRHSRPGRE